LGPSFAVRVSSWTRKCPMIRSLNPDQRIARRQPIIS
jgi:hypothetical protein